MNHRSNDLSALKTKILVIEAARRAISIPMTGASFLIILCFSFYRLTYFTEIKKKMELWILAQLNLFLCSDFNGSFGPGLSARIPPAKEKIELVI